MPRNRLAAGAVAALIAVPIGMALAVPAAADAADQANSQSDHSSGNAGTSGDPSSPQPPSNADFSDHGANTHGPYDSTRDGSPSLNGNGGGESVGKPCAGCVGKADNKNPSGQMPNGSDANAGYECDRNHGIGRSNPAHTSCQAGEQPPGDEKPPAGPPEDNPPEKAPPGEENALPDTGSNGLVPLGVGLGVLGLGGALALTSVLMRRRQSQA